MHEVRQLRFVELLEDAGLDLALEEVTGRRNHIVAGAAGEELRFEHVVGVEGIVAKLDSGRLGELLENLRIDIIGPVVDVQHPLALRGGRFGGKPQRDGGQADDGEQAAHGMASLVAQTVRPGTQKLVPKWF
jgi:hypothetical protein